MILSAAGLCIAFLLVILSYLCMKWYWKTKRFSHIPTPKGLIPILGHILRIPKDITLILKFNGQLFEETKSKIRVLWVGFLPMIGVYDVNIMENILKSNKHITKGATYSFVANWLKEGLITSDGEKWKSRRRLLTPAFHFGILKFSGNTINHHASVMVDYLKEKISTDRKVEMQTLFKSFSLAVICETAMGVRCNLYQAKDVGAEESKYVAAINEILDTFIVRIYKPWLHNNFIFKYLSSEGKRYFKAVNTANSFVRKVIESRIKNLDNENSNKSSIFVDILLDAYKKNEIDIDGIIEEVNTFMFAGHDTVSTALAWTLYMIGKNEKVQEKLYSEVDALGFVSRVDNDSLSQLKYLDCVVKESLRLHPPVPIVSRYFKEDGNMGGEKIPAGSTISMQFYYLHRDESLWENPDAFLPERFLNYSSEKKTAYAYSPFSAGPRNCIGQRYALLELKIVLYHLVRNFKFKSLYKESEMKVYSTAVLRAKNGIWLEVFHRN